MAGYLDTVYIMAYRQLKRFVRSRSRIIGSIVNPLIWLVFFGMGWSRTLSGPMARMLFGGVDYLYFLLPGVIAMGIFTASFISGITILFDKQFGFMKEILVAPVPRSAALLGRALGDSITALVQGYLILLAGLPLVPGINPLGALSLAVYGLVMALGFTSAGIALAMKITSHEGFQLVMSFLMLPILFLSGAFYPLDPLPEWMKALAYVNPLTYAVDGIRGGLVGISSFNPVVSLLALTATSGVLLLVAVLLFEKATLE